MPKKFIVGTRGSLLALTQCRQILNEIEKRTGAQFELEIIKTQGDLNTSVPLWQMEGENFFTKELDSALLSKKVDLVVHSYKDLGSKRPDGITIAAVTQRSYAHDILLVSKKSKKELASKESFIVGTSSPRRCANIQYHLKNFLPYQKVSVTTKALRGNVNTRVEKLLSGEYDAIVLALAGLERLAKTPESLNEMMSLTKDLDFMILPQSHFPSSASQGALAIECLEKDESNKELHQVLSCVHDEKTFEEVKRERKIFNKFGGGCHLSVGINVRKSENGYMHFIEGLFEGKRVKDSYFEGLSDYNLEAPVFVGMPHKEDTPQEYLTDKIIKKVPKETNQKNEASNLFVSSSYCFDYLKNNYKDQSIWTAGAKTMMGLAKNGYWVHGSSDSLGEEEIKLLRESKFLNSINPKLANNWSVLTHKESKTILGDVIDCYERKIEKGDASFEKSLKETKSFFWTSAIQYKTYVEKYPFIKEKKHYCGLGKTFKALRESGVEVTPIFNYHHALKGIQDANTN